jgi:uncharacterized membrane protein
METDNGRLIELANDSLKGRWWLAIGTYLLFGLIFNVLKNIPIAGTIFLNLIMGSLLLGLAIFSLSIARNEEARIEQLFQGFNRFGTNLVAYFLIAFFILLWTLILIIPGIMAALSYALTYFIIADDDSISAIDAMNKSEQMMYGYKLQLFVLCMMFFILGLLCLLTLGIGFIWLIPIINITLAKFYEDIKAREKLALTYI